MLSAEADINEAYLRVGFMLPALAGIDKLTSTMECKMETVIKVLNRSQSCYDARKLSHACLIEILRASYLSQLKYSRDELIELRKVLSNEDK
jgi:hypothetical protein